jgi:hypothetical protein
MKKSKHTSKGGEASLAKIQTGGARKRAARRVVSPGFPRAKPFADRSEVEAYFADEKITCLLCGRRLRSLGSHLRKIHDTSDDEYRKRYGIPWKRGLVPESSHAAYSNALTIERRKAASARLTALRPSIPASHWQNQRRQADWLMREGGERGARRLRGAAPYTSEDFEEFLERIKSGRAPCEVATDEDMPHRKTWTTYRCKNPDYDRRFREVWDAMPFAMQAKHGGLGPGFRAEVRRLFGLGLTDKQIAKRLGVTVMPCHRITKALRKGAELII